MTIETKSSFIYGYTVDETNFSIDFSEGAGELTAILTINDYTLTDFAIEVARAMTAIGTQEYSVSPDRETRIITVSSIANFDLLVSSGSSLGTTGYILLGMSGADKTGLNTYDSDVPTGNEYLPQFLLQEFIDFEDFQSSIKGSVNESASGEIEVISFGKFKFSEFNIKFATNIDQGKTGIIDNNPSGVTDLRLFMEYSITKGALEFIPDKFNPNTFDKMLLDSTASDSKGIGFRLYELYGRGLPNYFETKKLKWRLL